MKRKKKNKKTKVVIPEYMNLMNDKLQGLLKGYGLKVIGGSLAALYEDAFPDLRDIAMSTIINETRQGHEVWHTAYMSLPTGVKNGNLDRRVLVTLKTKIESDEESDGFSNLLKKIVTEFEVNELAIMGICVFGKMSSVGKLKMLEADDKMVDSTPGMRKAFFVMHETPEVSSFYIAGRVGNEVSLFEKFPGDYRDNRFMHIINKNPAPVPEEPESSCN